MDAIRLVDNTSVEPTTKTSLALEPLKLAPTVYRPLVVGSKTKVSPDGRVGRETGVVPIAVTLVGTWIRPPAPKLSVSVKTLLRRCSVGPSIKISLAVPTIDAIDEVESPGCAI
jgi:hypothetical protein